MAETSAFSGRIFVSYRREDSAYPAGWLCDRLVEQFGKAQIFQDVDSIELGDDFVESISTAVASCDVLLAVIGKRWLTVTGKNGGRRLDQPDDFVRVEIEAALGRHVRVIPILVDEAEMPPAEELPPSLAGLVRRNALQLSPDRFDYDTSRLLTVLQTTIGEMRSPGGPGASARQPSNGSLEPPRRSREDAQERNEGFLSGEVDTQLNGGLEESGGLESRPQLRWLFTGLLVCVVLVILAVRQQMAPIVAESRRFQPQSATWIAFLWLFPAVPITIALWSLATNSRWRFGFALGGVAAGALWISNSWAVMETRHVSPPRLLHLALLVPLIVVTLGVLGVDRRARQRVSRDRRPQAWLAVALVIVAMVLRVFSTQLTRSVTSSGEPLDWGLHLASVGFWIGEVVPLAAAALAALLWWNPFQSQALWGFLSLQVIFDVTIRGGSGVSDLQEGDVASFYGTLLYIVGCLCLLCAAALATSRRRGARPAGV